MSGRAGAMATSRRSETLIGVGIAVGAAGLAAIASRYLARRAHEATADGLVDWRRAEQLAVSRLRRAPGALSAAELTAAGAAYEAAMRRVVPLLEQQLGLPLPGVVERHAVVDRAGWARANIATFQHLIDHLEPHIRGATADHGFAAGVAKLANRFVTTQQVGFLLGYLGQRVLGQYDIALLSAEAEPGKLLFVEENIRATAVSLNVPLDDFRVWIALHETTHAYEFEANSWIRPYLRDHLEKQLTGMLDQAKSIQADGIAALIRRLRESQESPLLGFMGPEQRKLFEETQRVMSLLEGFSDWVMDEVGTELLPNVSLIRERFEARRNQRRGTVDRLISRLTGLDLKLEQYKRGEKFVSGVAAAGGRDAVKLIWVGPQNLPSEAELADPLAWLRRVQPLDIERLAAAAPGSRLVSVSLEGLADSDLGDIEVLLRGPLPISVFDRILARSPRLMWVHSATAGVERVLTPTALERGLAITNARGVFSDPIAEYVLMMILAVSRRLPLLLELQREKTWQPLEGREMADVTVGIVGLGSIGRRVAELVLTMGARVVAIRRSADVSADDDELTALIDMLPVDDINELMAQSDFIVLTLPLTPETTDMFDSQLLSHAKHGAWLINIARGALVDDRALIRAVREGRLGGAVLDAFREEPLPADSELYTTSHIIVTPHTAWSSGRVLDRSIELFCDNLERFRRGEPLANLVDPNAGY